MTTDWQATEQIDLNAIADLWMGGPAAAEETEQPETSPPEEGGAEAEPSAEPSNEEPKTQISITPEMRSQIAREELAALRTRAASLKEQRDLKALLESGDDAAVAGHYRETLAAQERQAEIDRIAQSAAGDYAEQTLMALLTPEFIGTLTQEEAQSLDPETFTGDDRQYIATIMDIKASKARVGYYDDAEVERRVAERLTGQRNAQRGQQFQQPSATALPSSSGEAERFAGLEGSALKDALWSDIAAGWESSDNS